MRPSYSNNLLYEQVGKGNTTKAINTSIETSFMGLLHLLSSRANHLLLTLTVV